MNNTKLGEFDIKDQWRFVEWLESKGLYSEFDSSQVMSKAHKVWAAQEKEIKQADAAIAERDARIKELEAKYHDLLYQVHNKIPGESRHETARRIIQQHENKCSGPAQQDLTAAQNAEGVVTHE